MGSRNAVHSASRSHRARRQQRASAIVYLPAVPTILLNGVERSIPADSTVAALVRELGLDPRQIAVERNREIVPRDSYASTPLAAGDALEIVTFVGGG